MPIPVPAAKANSVSDGLYSATTHDIRITVHPVFLEEQSAPSESRYVWAYHVVIENQGQETVQLLNRTWRITDALGQLKEVQGPGVVGEQPVLAPGERFEYTSGTPLPTPSGIMVGSYEMQRPNGSLFDAAIPAFSLDSPYETKRIN